MNNPIVFNTEDWQIRGTPYRRTRYPPTHPPMRVCSVLYARSPYPAGTTAASALSLVDGNSGGNPRRTSTESIGAPMAASSRAIFETPQAEVRCA